MRWREGVVVCREQAMVLVECDRSLALTRTHVSCDMLRTSESSLAYRTFMVSSHCSRL